MNFYKGELKNFDLCKIQKYIGENISLAICKNDKSIKLENNKEDLLNLLKENKKLYCSFGKREDKYLVCINENKYIIDDERSENSKGIFMGDAYFNKYDDINLGFLFTYEDGKIDIQSAIEGEGIDCRKYEIVDNCGDLNIEMKKFIDKFIV